MNFTLSLTRGVLIAVTLVASTMIASAQTRQGTPEANVWGGFEHQPSGAEVRQREKADDIGQSRQQRRAGDQEVEDIYNELMNGTRQGGSAQTGR